MRFQNELAKVLEVAQTAAMSGAMLLDELLEVPPEKLLIQYKKDDGDSPSSIIGTNISELVQLTIRRQFKDHLIVDEETATSGKTSSLWSWFVDPDDGSSNVEQGLPGIVVGVSVAFEGEVVVAAVGDRDDKTVLYAKKGHGTFLKSYESGVVLTKPKKMRVSEREVFYQRYFLDDGYSNNFNKTPKGCFESFIRDSTRPRGPGCMYMRSYGSMILHWKLLASGRADIVLADAVGGPWDTNPGCLLVTEAGGRICNIDGNLPTAKDHAALGTSGLFHEEIFAKFSECYREYPGFRGPKPQKL